LIGLLQVRHSKVTVFAPARLHMGFIDLSGALNRHFGSIGIALQEIYTRISVEPSVERRVSGASAQRADKCLTMMCRALNVPDRLAVTIESAIPEHVGLGSGTQMSLAIGAALNAVYDLGLTVREIAALMDRGLRSGIGIGIFEQGGLVVDGGRGERTITPPVLARFAVPQTWRFVLVFDPRGQGLHGLQEIEAFKQLPPFPQREAEHLCYLLLMQALPAVAENDLARFGAVITQLQKSVGEHFASAQGGIFTSPEVAQAVMSLAQQGAVAMGQTSWGPTGFCAFADQFQAAEAVRQTQQLINPEARLSFVIASARNYGAEISVD
jgi:beta-RFAP synthase